MRAIDRKLLRDLKGMWGQAVAIGFVIISGVGTFVAMTATMDSLQRTLATYYAEYRFADGFAQLRRAPERLAERLREIPGIGDVETRVIAPVNLEVAGFDEPVTGLIVSIPQGSQPRLNQLFLREGRLPRSAQQAEVVLNEAFAEAHGLRTGDELRAIINGRRDRLSIVGVGLSPEHLLQVEPGAIFPDPQRFGVMWMAREAVAAAYNMEGAFNSLSFVLGPDADIREIEDHLEILLKPYGSLGIQSRRDQPSHFYVSEEFAQLRRMSTILPLIFLAVAAFLLNIVVGRVIGTQREQIAVLKAFGYSDASVGLHYLKLVLVIAALGGVGGVLVGIWLGTEMAELYQVYFRFPYLEYTLRWPILLAAVVFTTAASLLGVIRAVRRAVKLPPAEAMRPAPPAVYRPALLERFGMQRYFDQPTRMIARNIERHPVKALLSIVGMGMACAILIVGLFFMDSFEYIVDIQYGVAERSDLTVTFNEPASMRALYEVAALPGVQYAEPFRATAVRLRSGHRTYETAINGIPDRPYLRRLLDRDLQPIRIPEDGLVLTERLAERLGVRSGDIVIVEVLEGTRRTVDVPVVALAQQYFGLGAYMDLDRLNGISGSGPAISGVLIATDDRHEDELTRQLERRPRVASIGSQTRIIESIYETSGETMLTMSFILTLFAGAIAFGVIYNSARITLSERDRELASLRVLGFTRGEVSYIMLGELSFLMLLSLPVGFALGAVFSTALVGVLATDLYEIPVVLSRATFAYAALVVIASALVSALIILRKLYRLDLIGVLKTRE